MALFPPSLLLLAQVPERSLFGQEAWVWLEVLGVLLGAGVAGWVLEQLTVRVAGRLASWTRVAWDDALVRAARGPLRLAFFALLSVTAAHALRFPATVQEGMEVFARSLFVVALAWCLLRFLGVSTRFAQEHLAQDKTAARARSVVTQLTVMRHVVEVAIWVVTAALLLMQFEVVRNVGVSLLASAGIAGLVLGLAAQKSISSLLAGIQLSITQPIRIGDQVVVEGEVGTVEEIRLTYVVVAVWDQRRLVVPIGHFLDKPFQNWSRAPAEMLGPVMLQVDYRADIDALRAELSRVLAAPEGATLWDGKTATVAVTEATDKTLQVRVLLSAAPDKLFDLRCLVRERLVGYLGRHPEWLPIQRTEPRLADGDEAHPEVPLEPPRA